MQTCIRPYTHSACDLSSHSPHENFHTGVGSMVIWSRTRVEEYECVVCQRCEAIWRLIEFVIFRQIIEFVTFQCLVISICNACNAWDMKRCLLSRIVRGKHDHLGVILVWGACLAWLPHALITYRLYVSFAEYRSFCRALLQKRRIILRSLLYTIWACEEYDLRIHLVAVCCSVLQCVAVCCSVLQCVAVCCSVTVDSRIHLYAHWTYCICMYTLINSLYMYVYAHKLIVYVCVRS